MKPAFYITLLLVVLGLFGFVLSFGTGFFQVKPANLPWYISRAAGIVAYLLMFIVIFLGTGMTTGFIYKLIDPLKAWRIHQNLSISLAVTIFIHVISIFFDSFMKFKLTDILIPFVSSFKPLYLSLGILGFYMLLAIILSSIFLRLKTPKLWSVIHFLTYPLFLFSFIHGVFIGTDSTTAVMQTVYWITGPIFVLLFGYRFIIYSNRTRA